MVLVSAVVSINAAQATGLLRRLAVMDVAGLAVTDWFSAVLVVALAVVTTLVLLLQYIEPVVLVVVVLVGLFIIVDNVREVLA